MAWIKQVLVYFMQILSNNDEAICTNDGDVVVISSQTDNWDKQPDNPNF